MGSSWGHGGNGFTRHFILTVCNNLPRMELHTSPALLSMSILLPINSNLDHHDWLCLPASFERKISIHLQPETTSTNNLRATGPIQAPSPHCSSRPKPPCAGRNLACSRRFQRRHPVPWKNRGDLTSHRPRQHTFWAAFYTMWVADRLYPCPPRQACFGGTPSILSRHWAISMCKHYCAYD